MAVLLSPRNLLRNSLTNNERSLLNLDHLDGLVSTDKEVLPASRLRLSNPGKEFCDGDP